MRSKFVLLIALALFVASGVLTDICYANSANISCGDPTKTGTVTVAIKITKADGTTRTVSWNAAISASDDANQKAQKIRDAAPPSDPDVTIGGTGNVVSATTKNAGDKITKMGLANDTTNETEAHNVFSVSVTGDHGIFSAEGSAVGGGSVAITYKGMTATVNTTGGETGAQIEDQLRAIFKGMGIAADISLVDPVPGVGTDGRYLYFMDPTLTPMIVSVMDQGIENDLAMMVDPATIPTLSQWGLIALALVLVAAGFFVMQRRRRLASN